MPLKHSFFDFDINVWVFIRIYNNEKQLKDLFKCISAQNYKLLNLLLIDDCSTDSSWDDLNSIRQSITNINKIVIERNQYTKGGAKTFQQALEYIKTNSGPNDIFTELSTNDIYLTDNSIEEIVINSLWNKSLFIYGCYLNFPIVKMFENDVKTKTKYYYACSTSLLSHFSPTFWKDNTGEDFKNHFISACLELSGSPRSFFLKKALCKNIYDNIEDRGNYKSVDLSLKSKSYLEPLKEEIHLILLTNEKQYNILNILRSIDNQITDKHIIVHVLNGNSDRNEEIASLKKGQLTNISLILCNLNTENVSISVLFYIRQYFLKTQSSYLIFINDSFLLEPTWVEYMYEHRSPLTYCCSNGFTFQKKKTLEEISLKLLEPEKTNGEGNGFYDYGLLNGSIIDSNVFLSSFVLNIPTNLSQTGLSLWLSFVTYQIYGKKIINVYNKLTDKSSPNVHNSKKENHNENNILKDLLKAGYILNKHVNLYEMENMASSAKAFIPNYDIISINDNESYNENIESNTKFAILCISIGNEHNDLFKINKPTLEAYSRRIGADLIVCNNIDYDDEFKATNTYRNNIICYVAKAFEVFKLLHKYDRVLLLDDSCFIKDNCPDLFKIVPYDSVGGFVEPDYAKAINQVNLNKLLVNHSIKNVNVKKYVNSGIMVFSKCHQYLLSKERILENLHCFSNFYPHQTYLIKMFMDYDVNVFDIGNKFNFMPAYEVGFYDVKNSAFTKEFNREQMEKLNHGFILHFTSFNKFRVDLLNQYKRFVDNKITLIVMNCHRWKILKEVVLPHYDLNYSHLINQIIVYHAKKETMFEYEPYSKNIRVDNIYSSEDEIRYGLFNRFIQAEKHSINECILIIDDDVIPNEEIMAATFSSWKKNKMNVHGYCGRVCDGYPHYKYRVLDVTTDRAPIVLTSFAMTSLELIKACISEEHKVYNLTKHYKPKWNGEDIFLSLTAVRITNQKNFIINDTKTKMIIFARDNFAISAGSTHERCRTQLCNAFCHFYNLKKEDIIN